LATKGDMPLGMLYCSTGEYHIGTDVLLTTIHNINVRRDVRESLSGGRVALGLMARHLRRRSGPLTQIRKTDGI